MKQVRQFWEFSSNNIFNYIELILPFNRIQRRVIFMATLLVANLAQASDYSPDPYWQGTLGPLTIRSLSPAQSLRLAPIPRSPYGLPEGQIELQQTRRRPVFLLKTKGVLPWIIILPIPAWR